MTDIINQSVSPIPLIGAVHKWLHQFWGVSWPPPSPLSSGHLSVRWAECKFLLCSEKLFGYWPSCGWVVLVSQSIRQKMFHICCCHHAYYCMLFSDLWPVYITLIGKLMLRKDLISLWHQFIEHDMTCEVCDSKHLCSFHFDFSALLIYFDFSRSWFRFKTPICLQGVNSTSPITRAHLLFCPDLDFYAAEEVLITQV